MKEKTSTTIQKSFKKAALIKKTTTNSKEFPKKKTAHIILIHHIIQGVLLFWDPETGFFILRIHQEGNFEGH